MKHIKDKNEVIIEGVILFLIILLGFILGWIFPIEGPLDWVYDDYEAQHTKKVPQKAAPPKKIPVYLIINAEELEELEGMTFKFDEFESN